MMIVSMRSGPFFSQTDDLGAIDRLFKGRMEERALRWRWRDFNSQSGWAFMTVGHVLESGDKEVVNERRSQDRE